MCIMEVRPGQHTSTIAQAMAHNTSTVERDLDMFTEVLKARGERAALAEVKTAQEHLARAYAGFLGLFGGFVAEEVQSGLTVAHAHVHEPSGHERTLTEQAHHDAQLARRFETR